jgi:2,4-dienoyl-CoA reductase (NADPH2)
MAASGVRGYLNYTLFHFKALRPIFLYLWNRSKKRRAVEGACADESRAIKQRVGIPVINTGGYQRGGLIRKVISDGYCDGVAIARSLIANNDLPKIIARGADLPERPCTFSNRCLVNAMANPLGCYDLRRFNGDHEKMVEEVMTVFKPRTFS